MNKSSASNFLDLRGTPCPINFIKCRLALEDLKSNEQLKVQLDKGEPETMVISGLKESGHNIDILSQDSLSLIIEISCARS
tara:strand:- start:193 stop:435 length:243 start_codon:yes stop_codon:yes gene_type:complete